MQYLDKWSRQEIAHIPEKSRVLVTAHDAFAYFGKEYGFQVKGLQGLSTDSDYGLKDVQELVDLLTEKQIKAVFVESSVSEKSINAVVEGAKEKAIQSQSAVSSIRMPWVKRAQKKAHTKECSATILTQLPKRLNKEKR